MTKGKASQAIRWMREGVKQQCRLVATALLQAKSYPICGIPSGLAEAETQRHVLMLPQQLEMTALLGDQHPLGSHFMAALAGVQVPEQGVVCIEKGLATALGGTLSSTGKLITTYLPAFEGRPPAAHTLFRFSTRRFFPRILEVEQPVITLTAGWQGAFYHWVHEVLPRLFLLEKGNYPSAPLYVEATHPFQRETLALLGIAHERILDAGQYDAVRAPWIWAPSLCDIPTFWSCQFLRSRFLPLLKREKKHRLYVSRADAGRRRIANEEALRPILEKHGFRYVTLSHLPFLEQAALFYNASVVLGPHGAGFAHAVFCDPGTPLCECFAPVYTHTCYWHIASRVGLPYYPVFGKAVETPTTPAGDPDIWVSPEAFEALLTQF